MAGTRLSASLLVVLLLACTRAATVPEPPGPPLLVPDPAAVVPPVVHIAPDVEPQSPPGGGLPDVPPVLGPLRIDVVYPPAGALLPDVDSSFVLGSVGRGSAELRINDRPVRVAPNGGWLAWLPLEAGPAVPLRLEAVDGTDTVRLVHPLRRAVGFRPPGRGPWIDTTSFAPTGDLWWPGTEYLPLSVRASPAARVALLLPGGTRVPLTAMSTWPELPAGLRAFDRDTMRFARLAAADRFHGAIRGIAIGRHPGPLLPGLSLAGAGRALIVEAVEGRDTVRAEWPLRLALLDSLPIQVDVDDDWQGGGQTDSITPGRALPGGSYHWFFPTGTRLAVTGRRNGDLRVELAPGDVAWVAAGEVSPVGTGPAPTAAIAGSVTATEFPDRAVLRLPVGTRRPFLVEETDRRVTVTVYHTSGDLNWIRYGTHRSPLIERISWRQDGPNLVLDVELTRMVWGTRARWDRSDLLLEVRRPPTIVAADPFRGLTIAIDPGHPPGGSTGPTRLTEAEANLGVAALLAEELRQAGARVVMTRTDASPIELWPRVRAAEQSGADLLISVHNNALPDGVNPLTNNGTSVFYHQARSLPLARAVQSALVERTGLADLGVARGDLALVRSTWMPAILTEGMFMIVPEQESALRLPEGRALYAGAVVAGIRGFLLWRNRVDQTSPY